MTTPALTDKSRSEIAVLQDQLARTARAIAGDLTDTDGLGADLRVALGRTLAGLAPDLSDDSPTVVTEATIGLVLLGVLNEGWSARRADAARAMRDDGAKLREIGDRVGAGLTQVRRILEA